MLQYLEQQTRLTGNQRRIIAAAILGDMLEFFDYFLIGYVVAFIAGPWKLTFGQSAIILLSSGFGAMFGAVFYGWLADKIGRRKVMLITVINFSVATGVLTFTPDKAWLFLAVFRFLIGFGVGGLYCVDLPLVQEFVPTSKRGMVGGLVTSAVPLGLVLGSLLGAYATPYVGGWRGLFAIGMVPGLLTLLIRAWVPESPRWLMRMGRVEEARKSLAWALEMDPASLPLSASAGQQQPAPRLLDIFKYPRSLAVSWIVNLGAQTGYYGFQLWAPTLLVQIFGIAPARAAFLMIYVNLAGFFGRIALSYLSDAIGRRASGAIASFGAAILLVTAAVYHDVYIGTVSVFWLVLIANNAFADGGFAIVGPYSGEVWPVALRSTGMGSAYGFGGLGKVIGPLGLALIIGSSNIITPKASIAALVPAYSYLAGWFALAGLAYIFIGMETKGRSLEAIEESLEVKPTPVIARQNAEERH
ncbi:MAG TPA: MFS transporter [Verrucomicrobiae bacterium]|jgi:putative MFS transporter|nr:MFS transporter [Verrucomicrobiae bacterium]